MPIISFLLHELLNTSDNDLFTHFVQVWLNEIKFDHTDYSPPIPWDPLSMLRVQNNCENKLK